MNELCIVNSKPHPIRDNSQLRALVVLSASNTPPHTQSWLRQDERWQGACLLSECKSDISSLLRGFTLRILISKVYPSDLARTGE